MEPFGPAPLAVRGERCAERWLRRRGYRLLQRNYHVGSDEADLVMLDPDGATVVLVEVKTREADVPLPEDAITAVKQQRMTRLALRLQQHGPWAGQPMRMDVIAIVWPRAAKPTVRHYEGVE